LRANILLTSRKNTLSQGHHSGNWLLINQPLSTE
jgi:hypothetical protein